MEIKYPKYYIYSYIYKKIEKTDPIIIAYDDKEITFANCIDEISISILLDAENNKNNHAEIEIIKINRKKINFNIPLSSGNYFSEDSEQQKYFIFQVALDVDKILRKMIAGEAYYSQKYL